ncbi:acyl-CoA thioesterase [Mesobacterium sp. TK19101]|uniref:Acyl-CoA thioesterase n=1 Tax=Mesobacterium hydrothermale TaxID=3111907 RepID=A0ABU6HBA8_9RHOB|nr:acyl-CoA thioesterase [Mesobacterium sp. TK19101]MEC3859747.1 acyl-CoA thioesterase [Mesobacterium sp. TK19101]
MYPIVRMVKELIVSRKAPALPLEGEHVSHHICWPWDLDIWMELNNGRTLTLYDLGRIPLARRVGLIGALARNRWGLTMAGACVRYRRRIRAFERVTMRSRAVCWDDRFIYLEQSMWKKNGECASHILYRSAVTDRNGIVPPARVLADMGHDLTSPPMPDWITTWIAAEAQRPWPPMQD